MSDVWVSVSHEGDLLRADTITRIMVKGNGVAICYQDGDVTRQAALIFSEAPSNSVSTNLEIALAAAIGQARRYDGATVITASKIDGKYRWAIDKISDLLLRDDDDHLVQDYAASQGRRPGPDASPTTS
jgi:hypothetical protein